MSSTPLKGAVIEVLDGGYVVTVVNENPGGALSLFSTPETIKKVFTRFQDAFSFLSDNLAPGERDGLILEEIERSLTDDPDPPDDHPCDDLGRGAFGD